MKQSESLKTTKKELRELSQFYWGKQAQFKIKDIEKMIPHRAPFLMIDRILEVDIQRSVAVGQKNTTANDPYFQGHFPNAPVLPGVLIVESLAQTGGVLIHQMGFKEKIPVICHLNAAKFRKSVVPGDTLITHCQGIHLTERGGKIQTYALVGDSIAAEVEIGYILVDPLTLV